MSKVKCPNCGIEIEIDKALEGQVEARMKLRLEEQHEKDIAAINKENNDKITTIKQEITDEASKMAQESIDKEIERMKKSQENTLIELQKDKEAESKTNEELRKELADNNKLLREAKKAKENAQLEADKKIAEATNEIQTEAKKVADEKWDLKYREMEKKLSDTNDALTDAKKKAEQGSQQNQGEVLELGLEECLKNEFPYDDILEVKTGQRGADIKHTVKNFSEECGLILWETKNAKWQPAWIGKFKEDIRESNAIVGILVSADVPESQDIFQIEGVWVTKPRYALSVGNLIRAQILAVHTANKNSQNKDANMECLYRHITGPEFKHRIEAIVDNYKMLRDELEKEKRSTARRWAKQEKSIDAVVSNTIGMYGDFQGLIGNALGDIKQLESEDEE